MSFNSIWLKVTELLASLAKLMRVGSSRNIGLGQRVTENPMIKENENKIFVILGDYIAL